MNLPANNPEMRESDTGLHFLTEELQSSIELYDESGNSAASSNGGDKYEKGIDHQISILR